MLDTGLNDTIAAISTAPGLGATGMVRISGSEAIIVANHLLPNKKLERSKSHRVRFSPIVNGNGEIIDEVLVTLFRSPKSYTGEDVVEISGHGSPLILGQILDACLDAGARLAKPGEFTQRAFLNGKMDLTQVEAVGDLIAATSEAAQRTALNHLRGGFSKDLNDLRDKLIHFSAMIELELDFGEEDVEFADRDDFKKFVGRIRLKTQRLIDSFRLGNVLKNGVTVAIIGRPNAGKSTLLNALLNEDRAIISDIPGTTRDTIEETLNIQGMLFRLIDTAGIRNHTNDLIEAEGIERSKANAAKADIILYVKDLMDDEPEIELANTYADKIIEVHTKFDLYYDAMSKLGISLTPDFITNIVMYPDIQEEAINLLKDRLVKKALGTANKTEDTIVTNARHHEALKKIASSLNDITTGLENGLTGDLIALDIRTCLHYLGEITGTVDVDRDVLGRIFSSFCIGK